MSVIPVPRIVTGSLVMWAPPPGPAAVPPGVGGAGVVGTELGGQLGELLDRSVVGDHQPRRARRRPPGSGPAVRHRPGRSRPPGAGRRPAAGCRRARRASGPRARRPRARGRPTTMTTTAAATALGGRRPPRWPGAAGQGHPRTASGSRNRGTQPSPTVAARRRAARLDPPIHTGHGPRRRHLTVGVVTRVAAAQAAAQLGEARGRARRPRVPKSTPAAPVLARVAAHPDAEDEPAAREHLEGRRPAWPRPPVGGGGAGGRRLPSRARCGGRGGHGQGGQALEHRAGPEEVVDGPQRAGARPPRPPALVRARALAGAVAPQFLPSVGYPVRPPSPGSSPCGAVGRISPRGPSSPMGRTTGTAQSYAQRRAGASRWRRRRPGPGPAGPAGALRRPDRGPGGFAGAGGPVPLGPETARVQRARQMARPSPSVRRISQTWTVRPARTGVATAIRVPSRNARR